MHYCSYLRYLSKIILIISSLFICLTRVELAAAEERTHSITLVGEDEWYPYAAYKNGKLQGWAVDIIDAAFSAVNVKVTFKSAPYARCLMLAETGQELACFDSLKDSKLSKLLLFHDEPIFKAEIGIYALQNSANSNLQVSDLRGKQVGVTHGYTYTDEVDTNQSINREVAPTDLSNLRKLLRQRSEYSLIYTRVVDYLMNRYPEEFSGKIKQVGSIGQNSLYVSFSRQRAESAKYAELLDRGLRKIKKNGTYSKLEQKWSKPEP